MSKISRDKKKKAAVKSPEKETAPTKSAKAQMLNYGKCCTCRSYECSPGFCKSKKAHVARKATCDAYKEN